MRRRRNGGREARWTTSEITSIIAANGAAAAKASDDVLAQTSVASVRVPIGASNSVAVNSVATKTNTMAAPGSNARSRQRRERRGP